MLQLTDCCVFCWRKTDTVTFLLFLILGDLEPWDYSREMFLMFSICVSCHWGNCHAKTLDNSHDKQKYFDKSQSPDAAEEEPSGTGAEEDPVLSAENSGGDSDALRLESKLIWPELCFWDKINSQALNLEFSLLSRVCFLLLQSHTALWNHEGDPQVGSRKTSYNVKILFTLLSFFCTSTASFARTNLIHLCTSLSS